MKLTPRDRIDRDTANVTIRYLEHLIRSQDHHLTNGDTNKLKQSVNRLRTLVKRIENDITP